LERLGAASYIVELIDRFTVQEIGTSALYDLLIGALAQLAQGAEPAP
ncbi:MAG: DNA repair protein RecO, partial [Anaerolineae bacterium]|nr:DNA repair protein RecO [Anaerolineae bacterium]